VTRVCVFCGSSEGGSPEYAAAARALAGELARRKLGLVYGGGSVGLMGVLADAALAGGVEVIGVILNKVIIKKIDYVSEFARRGLKRKGLELLGVLPHRPILTRPTMFSIQEELQARLLNDGASLQQMVDDVAVGAMGVHNVLRFFKPGTLLITPGDREDILLAASTSVSNQTAPSLAGIVLTDDLQPTESVMKVIRQMPFPVLLAAEDSYQVASKVHDLIVKTRPGDTEKISVIRDLIAKHVNVKKILAAL
ncbi:MAG: hypothetical protein HYZ36_08060, partial [Pedosphaera parvula]|nr:hypothetical protein [Pedosphaera parvula]